MFRAKICIRSWNRSCHGNVDQRLCGRVGTPTMCLTQTVPLHSPACKWLKFIQTWTVSRNSPSSFRIKCTQPVLIGLNLVRVENPKMFHYYEQLTTPETNYCGNKLINQTTWFSFLCSVCCVVISKRFQSQLPLHSFYQPYNWVLFVLSTTDRRTHTYLPK